MIVGNSNSCKKPTDTKPAIPSCYKTLTCDSGNSNTLPDIVGPIQTGDYYRQVLDENDDTHHVDSGLSPVYQQYQKISNLQMTVLEGVNVTVDSQTGIANGEGSSRLPPIFVPNVGDVLIVKLKNDVPYLLKVTAVKALSYASDTSYEVTYMVSSQADDTSTEYQSLLDKVGEVVHFDLSLYGQGVSSLVSEEDQAARANLSKYLTQASEQYYVDFTDEETQHLGLRWQNQLVYDPYLSLFTEFVIDRPAHLRKPIRITGLRNEHRKNILDSILNPQLTETHRICETYCTKSVMSYYTRGSWASRFALFKIGFVIDCQEESGCPSASGVSSCMSYDADSCYCSSGKDTDLTTDYTRLVDDRSVIKDPLFDDGYIFSTDYYQGNVEDMSWLEYLVHHHVTGQTVDTADLDIVWKDTVNWCQHSRYFYLPLLIAVTKAKLAGMTACL